MPLPTFLGIGAPRAGTTWLNTVLASHPDVYVPTLRDEVRFFDQHYERGLGWYESLFCPPEEAEGYRAIGEISPQYLECEECPQRIFAALPDVQLIVILRHPVNRAYSQYGFFVQRRNFQGSFEEFTAARPRSLERGFYGRYLRRYLRCFDRSRLLALVFESAFGDIEKTKCTIADFLGIDVDRFPPSAGSGKVNPSSVPKFRSLSGFVARTGAQLRRWHMEPIVDFAMGTRFQRILMKGDPLPPLEDGLKRRLSRMYEDEFDELERLMQIDLSCWRE
jgi:Sulfotransferase domain